MICHYFLTISPKTSPHTCPSHRNTAGRRHKQHQSFARAGALEIAVDVLMMCFTFHRKPMILGWSKNPSDLTGKNREDCIGVDIFHNWGHIYQLILISYIKLSQYKASSSIPQLFPVYDWLYHIGLNMSQSLKRCRLYRARNRLGQLLLVGAWVFYKTLGVVQII